MCIRTLASIARSPKAPESARVVAANSLLDRGWGKADQPHTGLGPINIIIRQILDTAQQSEPLVIEHEEPCDK